MITVKWAPQGKKVTWTQLDIVSCDWSGTENQAARQLSFTVPWNPYDKGFTNSKVTLGDRVKLYEGKKLLFSGIITSREKSAAIGTASFDAYDYMHYLLRGTVSRIFKDTTPKKATVSLCKQVGIKTGKLEDPNVSVGTAIYKEKPIYDIIIAMYRKAYVKNKVRYMPVMSGEKFSIIKKGQSCGVTLSQDVDITNATYHDTTDNMVNYVTIYSDKNQKKGVQKNDKLIKKYGTYMQAYTMSEKQELVNASTKAKRMLVGITKEASVEAIGNVECIAGRSLKILDKATGIKGTFYISSDSHSFRDGVHTMKLELSYTNTMEEGADEEKEDKK
jgi:hypothetical protein